MLSFLSSYFFFIFIMAMKRVIFSPKQNREKICSLLRLNDRTAIMVIFCFAWWSILRKKNIGLLSGPGKYMFENSDTDEQVKVHYYKPKTFDTKTPVVIILHGRKRNPKRYRDDWKKLAEAHNLMVLVPLFSNKTYTGSNGLNLGNIFASKHEIDIKNPIKKWSFALPDRVFFEFKQREPSQQPGYTLYGHGGGSQFATRFALMMPNNHACRVIAANPGWYTYPNRSVAWPYGLKGLEWVSDAQIDHYLERLFILMLGNDDLKRDGVICQTDIAEAQGKNRYVRGKHFFHYAQDLAKKDEVKFGWKMVRVPHVGHSDAEIAGPAVDHMRSCI